MPRYQVVVKIDCDTAEHAKDVVEEAMSDLFGLEEPQDELWDFSWSWDGLEVLPQGCIHALGCSNTTMCLYQGGQ